MVGAIDVHVSAAPNGMPKSPVLPAPYCLLGGPAPRLKVKEPDGLHLGAPCMMISQLLHLKCFVLRGIGAPDCLHAPRRQVHF